jgi:hypothetical protein
MLVSKLLAATMIAGPGESARAPRRRGRSGAAAGTPTGREETLPVEPRHGRAPDRRRGAVRLRHISK